MKRPKKKLGEILVEAGLIDELQLSSCLGLQNSWGGRLGSIILRRGFVTEAEMMSALARQLDMPSVTLDEMRNPPEDVLKVVKGDVAKKLGFFPLGFEGRTMLVATADPTDLKTLDEIGFVVGTNVKPVIALESDIMKAIARTYGGVAVDEVKKEEGGRIFVPELSRERLSAAQAGIGERAAAGKGMAEPAPAKIGQEAPQKVVLESLVELLISKGVITREELIGRIRAKGQP